MEAFLQLMAVVCLVVLLAGAVGFGLTLGIYTAMKFQPWSIAVHVAKPAAAGKGDEAEKTD